MHLSHTGWGGTGAAANWFLGEGRDKLLENKAVSVVKHSLPVKKQT